MQGYQSQMIDDLQPIYDKLQDRTPLTIKSSIRELLMHIKDGKLDNKLLQKTAAFTQLDKMFLPEVKK